MNLKNLSLAESFAMVRVIGFPLVLIFMLLQERTITAWLYVILFSSDFVDGFFAYFYNQESARRAKLDSLGDILLLLVGVLGFYLFEKAFFMEHLFPIMLVLGLYLLQLGLALWKWGRPSSFHTIIAKLTAGAQVIFIGFTLMFEASTGLFYLAVIASIIDVSEEIILTLLLPKWQANIKGLLWYYRKKSRTNKNT